LKTALNQTLKHFEIESNHIDIYENENKATGTPIFNNTKIKYLSDGGADKSILSEDGYNKIKNNCNINKNDLIKYSGAPVKSANGQIKVIGNLKLNKCIVDPDHPLENVQILVAKIKTSNDCLLGRDLMYQIPELKNQMLKMKNRINNMSKLKTV